jgi:ppGpp synthetase/RelA/SpoT-type nucleotidyltranferase
MLTEQAVNVTVTGRMKELYSLWSKMVKHNRTLDQIQDVVALRVSKILLTALLVIVAHMCTVSSVASDV